MLPKETVANFIKELELKAKLHEEILNSSRKIIILSKQAVMAIHRQELSNAISNLTEAESMIRKLDEAFDKHPDIGLGAVRTAYQEYAEAKILLASIEGRDFPLPKELGIPTISYILGLADAVGEFRRATVEALKRGKLNKAEHFLQTMEEIYRELFPLEEFYNVIPDLRRKIDIARHLIELTLGDVSSEVRRSSLERAIKVLEKRIGAKEGET